MSSLIYRARKAPFSHIFRDEDDLKFAEGIDLSVELILLIIANYSRILHRNANEDTDK